MITYNDMIYRNLEEQVLQNLKDVEVLKKKAQLADLGINIITPTPFQTPEQLPLPYDGEYGDGFLVGNTMPYELYIWTRDNNEYNGEWFDWGVLNAPSIIPGPIGEQGPTGPQGTRGSLWSSQSGAPTQIQGVNNDDQALNTTTGDVYQFVNGVWQITGNIRGPRGLQGPQGIGEQGPTGPQGPQGPKGDTGIGIYILDTLETSQLLPDPKTVPRNCAYLIGTNVYIIIGEGTESDPLVWHNAGSATGGGGSSVIISGVRQNEVDLTSVLNSVPIYDISNNETVRLFSDGTRFGNLNGISQNLQGAQITKNNSSIFLPIVNSVDIERQVDLDVAGRQRLGFSLSQTYKDSVTNQISTAVGESIQITAPTTATQGQISEEDLAKLQSNNQSYILFNNEIYRLQDTQHDSGYLVYSHIGYDNTALRSTVKNITLTISTRSWVLTSNKLPIFTLNGTELNIEV